MFEVIKVLRSPSVSFLYLRRQTCGFVLFRVLVGVGVEARPRQASVLACVVLAGTREGLVSLRSSNVNSYGTE